MKRRVQKEGEIGEKSKKGGNQERKGTLAPPILRTRISCAGARELGGHLCPLTLNYNREKGEEKREGKGKRRKGKEGEERNMVHEASNM